MLVKLGYKEIEVSFPSASETDFNFTQNLIKTPGIVPNDVWLQVLSPCRKDFIRRTVDSVKGAERAIIHLYLATSPCFQQIVFNMKNEDSLALAVECTKYLRSITKDDPSQQGTDWQYEFSPETFSDTDPAFAVEVCNAVKAAWEPSTDRPIIFNLPATVELSTPNVYADQIEYFCTNITEREKISVSLHCHNDRGCAVAATELGQMAGADRVEGTLFGNGERTGNVDLVTLALNLYTQGLHPGVDFSDINSVIGMVERSNKIPVHERSPYGGQLVCCAFSGSHQDAINKGFQARKRTSATEESPWQMPYLPLDPRDIGRNYEAIIRVNSQSGKGGVAWIVQRELGLELPRGLQVAFSRIVQKQTELVGKELLPRQIQKLFEDAYHIHGNPRMSLIDYEMTSDRSASPARFDGRRQSNASFRRLFTGIVEIDGKEHQIRGTGNGPVSSLSAALQTIGLELEVTEYSEHHIGGENVGATGKAVTSGKAAAYIQVKRVGDSDDQSAWGVGINADVTQAPMVALLSAASPVSIKLVRSFARGRRADVVPSSWTKSSSKIKQNAGEAMQGRIWISQMSR